MEYANDFEVRQATLTKLGGDPTNLTNIYEVDLAILDKTSGGGAVIDDTTTSTTKVWSSSKTNSEITGSTQDMATKTWVSASYAKVITLTQAQYDALATKDPMTIYIISDAQ